MAASRMELCFRRNPGTIVQHDVMVYNGWERKYSLSSAHQEVGASHPATGWISGWDQTQDTGVGRNQI